jgi:hypothetical protein
VRVDPEELVNLRQPVSNAKALSTYIGHANIATTLDLYGHLMPGNERGQISQGRAVREDNSIRVSGSNTQIVCARPGTIVVWEGDPIPIAFPR